MAAPLRIEIVSDVTCPWCLLGSRRLDVALAGVSGVEAEVVYRPFLLEPELPPGGADLRASLRRRYGDPEPMFRRIEKVAKADGVPLDFARIGRTVSTVRAHTLLRHAAGRASGGAQRALARTLFGAYFLEGRDVSDLDVLEPLATRHGFAPGEARALALDPREEEITRAEAAEGARVAVAGVPFTTIVAAEGVPGAIGSTISGAQPVEVFRRAIGAAIGSAQLPAPATAAR